jgi:ubiquinone/menaquinone biosynthesis C-methylase UbiE
MRLIATNGSPSEFGDSGIEVRPQELRVIPVLDLTADVLRRSGIKRGMRVLDLGCGSGDASLLIAKMVGPSGLVVGVDESVEALDEAERRATVAGHCYWTRFVRADPDTFVPPERFDAVVVPLILLGQGEPATFLRLSACVRPDGMIMVVSPAGRSQMPIRSFIEIGRLLS